MNASLHSILASAARAGFDFRFLLDAYERDPFLHGIVVSIEIIVATMVGSAIAGLALLVAVRGRRIWLANAARAFIELTRSTPTLVQLYCAFLVVNMLITQWLQMHHADNPFKPFFWIVLVLSLHKGAFHAEALRAGFDALPAQTIEGAVSLGLDRTSRFWRIELPLALRTALPTLVNNAVELVKASALASAIAVGRHHVSVDHDLDAARQRARAHGADSPVLRRADVAREPRGALAGTPSMGARLWRMTRSLLLR
jgi:polar amino acid transport system permease protein